jgi:hypothetical protein
MRDFQRQALLYAFTGVPPATNFLSRATERKRALRPVSKPAPETAPARQSELSVVPDGLEYVKRITSSSLPFYMNPKRVLILKEYEIDSYEPVEAPKKHRPSADARRKAREDAADGHYTEQDWADLKVKYSNCCLRCGSTDKQIVADHITPLFRGGSGLIGNIQPLCWECNLWKGLKIIDFRPDATATVN